MERLCCPKLLPGRRRGISFLLDHTAVHDHQDLIDLTGRGLLKACAGRILIFRSIDPYPLNRDRLLDDPQHSSDLRKQSSSIIQYVSYRGVVTVYPVSYSTGEALNLPGFGNLFISKQGGPASVSKGSARTSTRSFGKTGQPVSKIDRGSGCGLADVDLPVGV